MNSLTALGLNFGLLVVIMIILWLISVRIRDVSFIDAFWAYGMAIMASASFLQTETQALWPIRSGRLRHFGASGWERICSCAGARKGWIPATRKFSVMRWTSKG